MDLNLTLLRLIWSTIRWSSTFLENTTHHSISVELSVPRKLDLSTYSVTGGLPGYLTHLTLNRLSSPWKPC